MKNQAQEFEAIQGRIDELFGSEWFKRPTKKEPYVLGQATNQYLSDVETGAECAPNSPNKRFTSEPATDSGLFYSIKRQAGKDYLSPTGIVDNIKPFLLNSGLTKKDLRCYDLKKDKFKIAWLYNGTFHATTLDWDKKQKKVIFQGTWKSGIFLGLKTQNPNSTSPSTYNYYVLNRGNESGPFTFAQMVTFLKRGKLKAKSVVRLDSSNDYIYVEDDKNLSKVLGSITPKTSGGGTTSGTTSGTSIGKILKPVKIKEQISEMNIARKKKYTREEQMEFLNLAVREKGLSGVRFGHEYEDYVKNRDLGGFKYPRLENELAVIKNKIGYIEIVPKR